MARYPALEIHGADAALVLAAVDECSPSAAEDLDDGIRLYFARSEQRDRATEAVRAAWPSAQLIALDVDDEDWARRSQADLKPVTVGRITVVPAAEAAATASRSQAANHIVLVIQPSMGFGTGHHATTRLCLAALQAIDVAGKSVLDVGTGSGILAIAAERLGADRALGIDNDADAVAAAIDNLSLNADVRRVVFRVTDLRDAALEPADIVCANLTGALLVSAAPLLRRALRPGGTLVVSGLLADEEESVRRALEPAAAAWRGSEQEWVALAVNYPDAGAV